MAPRSVVAALDETLLAEACANAVPAPGDAALIANLSRALPGLDLSLALAREGWHRSGGVVGPDKERIAESLRDWAEAESDGDVTELIVRHGDSGYFATRVSGRSLYLVAPTGETPLDFVQIEVEETQEVLDRALFGPDWMPDDLDDFLDPLDFPRVEPEPVGPPRYALRRVTDFGGALDDSRNPIYGDRLFRRFMNDWQASSAGTEARFCDHWVLTLVPYTDRFGAHRFDVKPRPAASVGKPWIDKTVSVRGWELGKLLHGFDRDAGFPMAWYFLMVTGNGVSHPIGEAVNQDLMGAFAYLPAKDVQVLRAWAKEPYAL